VQKKTSWINSVFGFFPKLVVEWKNLWATNTII
jgi:hypothetical protein